MRSRHIEASSIFVFCVKPPILRNTNRHEHTNKALVRRTKAKSRLTRRSVTDELKNYCDRFSCVRAPQICWALSLCPESVTRGAWSLDGPGGLCCLRWALAQAL